MTTIYLIRHAEAEGNLYRRIHGWYNALITDNGFQQIKALEDRFRDIPVDAVYSSDLYRTMTTARAVYVPKSLPLRTDPGLREISMGSWEDLTWGEARHFHLPALELFNATSPDWSVPNGESFAQLGERMEGTVRHIAQQHLGQTVALFSHGMAIRQFLGRVKAVPPAQWHAMPHGDNTAGVSIDDCEAVSRPLSDLLDEADPIEGSYTFEVSSAGADRALKKPEHFAIFQGAEVEVRLYRPREGRKEFVGTLKGYEDGAVTLDINGVEAIFTKQEIALVRLYLRV